MSDKIQGRVDYINERDTKIGKMYSIKVGGTNYGVGKYPPRGIEQGDMVEFGISWNGNFPNVERGTLRKAEGDTAPPSKAPAGRAGPQKVNSYDDRQTVISKQAALNTALSFLELALKAEKLPVPAAKNQGFGYLRTLWMEEAAKLYELNTGEEWEMPEEDIEEEAPRPTRKKATKKAAKKQAPEPEEDEDEEEFEDDDLPAW